jgi:peptidoglycan/xylan/chitin deacetylase (PgdA/CDA1 family)
VIKRCKRTVLQVARAAGVFRLMADSFWRRNRLLILCYHGLSLRDEHVWNPLLYMTPERFREHMEIIRRRGANVLTLDDAIDRLQAGTLPRRSVVITFDDGFYDFYRYAWPVLHELNFPSTVYLTTYYCRHPLPVFDLMVDYLLWKSGARALDAKPLGLEHPLDLSTVAARWRSTASVLEFTRRNGFSALEKDAFARRLADFLNIDYAALVDARLFCIMRPEQVRETAKAGIGIELHTHRHRTPVDHELFLGEVKDNLVEIADLTGRRPRHFCYPSGVYQREFLPWLEESGVCTATTCDEGFATAGDNLLLLPRLLDDSRVSREEFDAWLCGLPN